jgi:hypothetical protein
MIRMESGGGSLVFDAYSTLEQAGPVPENSLVSTTQPDKKKACVEKTSSSWMCSVLCWAQHTKIMLPWHLCDVQHPIVGQQRAQSSPNVT